MARLGAITIPLFRRVPGRSRPAQPERQARDAETTPVATPARPGLATLAGVFAYLGSISIGGRSISYVQDEVVERRHWLTMPDFIEYRAFAIVLPGPSAPNLLVSIGHVLRGRAGAVVSVFSYVLPGAAVILAATLLTAALSTPPWLEGTLRGAGAASIGLLAANLLRNLPSARTARFGPLFALLAALGIGPLGLSLVVVLLALAPLSLYLNRPRS